MLVYDKCDRAINCVFCRGLPISLLFSGLLKKGLYKGRWSLAESFFNQNYCHACHTRFAVFFPLPSCCVSSLVSLLNRTAGRRGGRQNAPVLQEWQGHYLRVLSWSSLNIILCFLVFYKMICFKFFKQNYCHTCQTRFAVFFHVPSCCVSSLITGLTTRGQHNLSTICFRNRFYCKGNKGRCKESTIRGHRKNLSPRWDSNPRPSVF